MANRESCNFVSQTHFRSKLVGVIFFSKTVSGQKIFFNKDTSCLLTFSVALKTETLQIKMRVGWFSAEGCALPIIFIKWHPCHILRRSSKEICRVSNISLCNVEEAKSLIWQKFPLSGSEDYHKSRSPMLCQWDYRDFVQVLAICSEQVLAGRRINFEGLAFTSEAVLRQNTSDHAVSRPCLPFPPNNSEILGKVWQSL